MTQQANQHSIIFSHGFGVREDDRGLFPAIAAAMPKANAVIFPYNDYDTNLKTLLQKPLDVQAAMLTTKIAEQRLLSPEGIIDIICHSQGCVAAGLAHASGGLLGVRKIVLLTPPDSIDSQRTTSRISDKPGIKFDRHGMTEYPSKEGFTRLIPATVWDAMDKIGDVPALYAAMGSVVGCDNMLVINTLDDDVLGVIDLRARLQSTATVIIRQTGGHNFDNDGHASICSDVAQFLSV